MVSENLASENLASDNLASDNISPVSKRCSLDTGLDYHYLEWGQENSHTLVLVHGFLDFCAGWSEMVSFGLAKHFHVIAPDMRGHGDSDRIGAGGYYHFMDYVADLHSFITKVGKKKVSLVGHSMGGSIAGYYAGSVGQDLHRLILMEGMGPPDNQTPSPERVANWIRGWSRARARTSAAYSSLEEAAAKLRGRDLLLSEELSLKLAKAGTRQRNDGKFVFKHDPLHLSQGPIGYSVAVAGEFWQRIACPLLLLDGADTEFEYGKEEEGRRLSYLPTHTRVTVQGAGHMMQRHKPEQIAELLIEFLRD